jgi:hypothetical protein
MELEELDVIQTKTNVTATKVVGIYVKHTYMLMKHGLKSLIASYLHLPSLDIVAPSVCLVCLGIDRPAPDVNFFREIRPYVRAKVLHTSNDSRD